MKTLTLLFLAIAFTSQVKAGNDCSVYIDPVPGLKNHDHYESMLRAHFKKDKWIVSKEFREARLFVTYESKCISEKTRNSLIPAWRKYCDVAEARVKIHDRVDYVDWEFSEKAQAHLFQATPKKALKKVMATLPSCMFI